jgi:hypothetical protein
MLRGRFSRWRLRFGAKSSSIALEWSPGGLWQRQGSGTVAATWAVGYVSRWLRQELNQQITENESGLELGCNQADVGRQAGFESLHQFFQSEAMDLAGG